MESISSAAPLIVSVSGVRGIVGKSLTPSVVQDFAATFGTPLRGKTIAVSRDGRSSGEMFAHACIAGLLSVGCHVEYLDVAATPTTGFYVKSTGAAGGIQITASHNPPEWNGLKLFRPDGFVLSPEAGKIVADRFRASERSYVTYESVGRLFHVADPHKPHIERVLSLVDVESIRRRRFRIALDCNHGSGGVFAPRLLRELGCEVEVLGGKPDGQFEHPPEPTEANLVGFSAAVKKAKADIGFAVDPDADRLAIVDDQGRYIGEEYTLALAIQHRVSHSKGPIVINGSTSRVSEDVAKAAGCPVTRTPVGEVHVAEKMIALGAILGGEGNGGVIDPRVGFGRDSAIGMALILEYLASESSRLSERMASMPVYHIQKDKLPLEGKNLREVLERIGAEFPEGKVDTSDGVRIDLEGGWVQVRASNTEPIVRVIAEAKTAEETGAICARVRKHLEG